MDLAIKYLGSLYHLEPIDFICLNKEKLCMMYNNSDIDALKYMLPFCENDNKKLCERLIELNLETDIGGGDKPAIWEEQKEYGDGKWKLLSFFGIENDLGDAKVNGIFYQ